MASEILSVTGDEAKLVIGDRAYCFERIDNRSVAEKVDDADQAICGGPEARGGRRSPGVRRTAATILMRPTVDDWPELMEWVRFTEANGNERTMGTDTVLKDVYIDHVAGKLKLSGLGVDRAVIQGQRGGRPMSLQLSCVGKDFDSAITTIPSHTAARYGGAYPFSGGVTGTVGGTARRFDRSMIVIDNRTAARVNHDVAADDVRWGKAGVYFACSTPAGTEEWELANTFVSSATGLAGQFRMRLGTKSLTFSFPELDQPMRMPDVEGFDTEIRFDHYMQAYRTESEPSVKMTIQS